MPAVGASTVQRVHAQRRIVHAGSEFGVLTVTVGLSTAGPEDCKSVAQCLAEASDLVMAAKRNGQRNQVHFSSR